MSIRKETREVTLDVNVVHCDRCGNEIDDGLTMPRNGNFTTWTARDPELGFDLCNHCTSALLDWLKHLGAK